MHEEAGRDVVDLGDVVVEVVRKRIKNVHLHVYPPDGRVVVSAPTWISSDEVDRIVRERASWVRDRRSRALAVPASEPPRIEHGADVLLWGVPHRLDVRTGRPGVRLCEDGTIEMSVRLQATRETRSRALDRWYRAALGAEIDRALSLWQPRVGRVASGYGIRRMTTRWGTCNTRTAKLWFALELARRPRPCLDYVVVHELCHLYERRHDARFWGRVEAALPQWRELRAELERPSAAT